MNFYKEIKSVATNQFELSLVETESGRYCIISKRSHEEKPSISEMLGDYAIASHLFDVKLQEMEGN